MALVTRDRADALRALGLPLLASHEDIRAAWKRLAFETHPDGLRGNEDEFARIRAAYDLLRRPMSRPVSRVPSRPAVETRVTEISEAVQSLCRDALTRGDTPVVLWTSWLSALTNREQTHLPTAIRRCGRQIAYLMPTPLEKGVNRVAVPEGELEDPRTVRARVLQFTSEGSGPGRIGVPAEVVAAMFSGARSVHLHFG